MNHINVSLTICKAITENNERRWNYKVEVSMAQWATETKTGCWINAILILQTKLINLANTLLLHALTVLLRLTISVFKTALQVDNSKSSKTKKRTLSPKFQRAIIFYTKISEISLHQSALFETTINFSMYIVHFSLFIHYESIRKKKYFLTLSIRTLH